ncbi:T9SS type A sorting domain-containing protein [Taibaiella soli]|uniref:Secretion system C-terminal sorting domain-containing protein n=1 Tax=Taibaiella soli TaxID=1649169 RepID=A0A2W2A929_9BACT|nr:T9SS type A sorting domain-containing protein [Taibaiella soli]PZF71771.1 hypothetical protein DN068_17045 [Taibaiella soli]
MKKTFLLLLSLVAVFSKTNGQCLAPTNATVSLTNITCAGSGAVSVNSVTGSSGSIDLANCLFSLYDAANTTVVKPIQSSSVLSGLSGGTYVLHIQQVCQPSGVSPDYIQTVAITGTYNQPVLSTPSITQPICGNDGSFTTSATQGYGTYQYCLVDSLNAPAAPTHYVSGLQSSGTFSGLASGNYYVRVYDGCNGFVTRQVTVPAAVVTPGNPMGNIYYNFGCPDFNLRIPMAYMPSSLPVNNNFWVIYPDGSVDSFKAYGGSPILSLNGGKFTSYPATITAYFKNQCGTVWSKPFTFNKPKYTLKQSYNASQYNCSFGSFTNSSVSINDLNNSMMNNGYAVNNIWDQYSVDGGFTWIAYNPSDTLLVPKGGSRTVLYRNNCANIIDTVTLNMAGQQPLVFTLSSGPLHCTDRGTIVYNVSSYNGSITSILVHVVSKPAAQSAIPDFYYTGGSLTTNINLVNLIPGTYTIQMTDMCGATATQSINLTASNPVNYSAQPIFTCGSNTIAIRIDGFPTISTWGWAIGAKVYNSAGTLVANTNWMYYIGNSWNTTYQNLAPGIYTVKLFQTNQGQDNFISMDTVCATTLTVDARLPQALALNQSTFAKCTNDLTTGAVVALPQGGLTPYTYTLYKGSVATGNIVGTPQSTNVFSGLDVNATYIITATDQCGAGASYTNVFANVQPTVSSSTPYVPCVGDSIKLSVTKNPGLFYQWTKNGVNITGATDTSYQIKPMTMADSGAYMVAINANSCILLSMPSQLNPKNCGVPIPLAINLVSFSGRLNAQNNAVLSWEVAQPETGAEFEVLYSTDGAHFSNAGKIYQDGHSVAFTFTHNLQITGNAYYKLLMTENNNKESYSTVLVLHGGNEVATATATVSPVPFTESFNVLYTAAQNGFLTVQLTDVNGRTLKTQQSAFIQGANSIAVSGLTTLANGIYFLNLVTDRGEKQIIKVQK